MRTIYFFIAGLIMMLTISQALQAQIPRTLSYQGVLTDSLGNPKPDGSYSITFRLYDVINSGTALWTEAKTVQVKRGLFTTILGDQTVLSSSLKFDKPYWLSIQVATEPELSPRLPLTAVGYSLYSTKSDTANFSINNSSGWIDSANIVRLSTSSDKVGLGISNPVAKLEVGDLMRVNGTTWPSSGRGMEFGYSNSLHRGYIQVYNRDSAKWGSLYLGDGNVGIGTTNPADKFTVNGVIRSLSGGFTFPDGSTQTTAAQPSSGITLPYSGSASTTGNVFAITNLGIGKAIYGKHNNSNNYGYLGGNLHGVFGQSNIGSSGKPPVFGAGVYGKNTSSGYGVHGESVLGYGLSGESDSSTAIYGRNNSTGTYGTIGSPDNGVYGKRGENFGTLGDVYDGVVGVSKTNNGYGVAGYSESSSGIGVHGKNSSSGTTGMLGGNDFAVKADGDLVVTGAYKGNIGPNQGAPFPRPAWDSRWVAIGLGEEKTLNHNIGGEVDNYVVDMQFKDASGLIIGSYFYLDAVLLKGLIWYNLTSTSIKVKKFEDFNVDKVRIRIWVYN